MTAKKKTTLTPTKYRRRDQVVEVLEGASVLLHDGEMPAGVTRGDNQELLFQGVPILDGTFLVFDQLGNPLDLWAASDFKETYDSDFEGYKSSDELKGDLAQATAMVKKYEEECLHQDARVDRFRKLVENVATALGLDIGAYENEDAFTAAIGAKAASLEKAGPAAGESSDSAKQVLRDILRIEPAQNRDDGGRIIHLNKKIIDRASFVLG